MAITALLNVWSSVVVVNLISYIVITLLWRVRAIIQEESSTALIIERNANECKPNLLTNLCENIFVRIRKLDVITSDGFAGEDEIAAFFQRPGDGAQLLMGAVQNHHGRWRLYNKITKKKSMSIPCQFTPFLKKFSRRFYSNSWERECH